MSAQRVDVSRPAATLSTMPLFAGQHLALERLDGGLTNRNYLVRTPAGDNYVARFSGAKSDFLAIDRDAEAYNTRVAAGIGVAPDVIAYVPDQHALIVRWLDARTLADTDLDDEAMLDRVAATCRTMHAGPRFVSDFDMFAIQRRYLDIVRARQFRLPEDYLLYEGQVRAMDDVLHRSARTKVACHNDLLAANILDDGERIWLIDFEYSGNNDPCFELGNIWSEADLPLDRLEHLVTAYFGVESPVQVARARLFAVMAKYGWTLWASIQDAVSDVDFDFWQWGMERYVRAAAEFRSSAFDELIGIVRDDTKGA